MSLVRISELYRRKLPGLPASHQTIVRFITRGVLVRDKDNSPRRVFLEGVRVGRTFYTSEEAWYSFIYQCSSANPVRPMEGACDERLRDSSGDGRDGAG